LSAPEEEKIQIKAHRKAAMTATPTHHIGAKNKVSILSCEKNLLWTLSAA